MPNASEYVSYLQKCLQISGKQSGLHQHLNFQMNDNITRPLIVSACILLSIVSFWIGNWSLLRCPAFTGIMKTTYILALFDISDFDIFAFHNCSLLYLAQLHFGTRKERTVLTNFLIFRSATSIIGLFNYGSWNHRGLSEKQSGIHFLHHILLWRGESSDYPQWAET